MGILSRNDGGYHESYGEMKARLEKDRLKKERRRERYLLKKALKAKNNFEEAEGAKEWQSLNGGYGR